MKRFVKQNVFALVALLFLGVADAWGLGINKNVPLNLEVEGGNGSWNQNSKTMTWKASTWNLLKFTDWSKSDLSGYDKMVINVGSATNGKAYRVVINIDGVDYTYSTSGSGTKSINIKSDFKDQYGRTPQTVKPNNTFKVVESIRIGGNSEPSKDWRGRTTNPSITINSIKFHKPLEWDAQGKITFSAQDFNLGNNVTRDADNFTFSALDANISLDFDSNDDLATTDIMSIVMDIKGPNGTIQQGFNDISTKDRYSQQYNGGNDIKRITSLINARKAGLKFGKFFLFNNSQTAKPTITLNYVTFVKKETSGSDLTKDLLFFEDFESMTDESFLDGANAPIERPSYYEQGNRYLYGGRGKIMKDPTFNNYYQNLSDADEFTKSLCENYLRFTLTDRQRHDIYEAIQKSKAATIGFWVNGQVAVDYELPLERGSMFCIFSNDRFRKADNVAERPRFMFDLSCNGWVYSYMPNTNSNGQDVGMNYFFYGEKYANSGVQNPLGSLFGKDNYTNTLDQSKHKFYDDKKWHYVTYVMDNDMTRVKIYLDGVLTGTVDNVKNLPNTNNSESEFWGDNDYLGRTLYLRNIILGGFTPHGRFYDKQYYSDAALAYDDIAMYGRALSQDEIISIINKKQYTLKEWHYGDSFDEYNESKGGHEQRDDITGLGLHNPIIDPYLEVNKGTLTIPNVPKGYYVRIEYSGSGEAITTNDNNFSFEGLRLEDKPEGFLVATYKAKKDGVNNYQLDIIDPISVRSIVITPYQYAKLKYGNMVEDLFGESFEPLDKYNKYVEFNVKRVGTSNYYYTDDEDPANVEDEAHQNPTLPVLKLNIDGELDEDGEPKYKNINKYIEGTNNPYIKYTSTSPHVAYVNKYGTIKMTGIAGNTFIIAELFSDNLYNGSEVVDSFEICIKKEGNTLRLKNNEAVAVNEKFEDLDNVTLTIGGWLHNNGTYTIPGVGQVSDSWANATNFKDPILGTSGVLDGFTQYSVGTYVAKSESYGNNNGTDDGNFYPKKAYAHNVTPWTLPCRGGYVKFEPLKAGIVTLYLRQEGNLYDKSYIKGQSKHVTWRPIYITDEKGKPVDFVQTATNGLITYEDNFFVGDKRRAQFIEGIDATYNTRLLQDLKTLKNNDYEKFRTLIDNWNNAGWRQKVIPTGDGGYMVMSDAVVRYTFNVHPGKTYYLFSNDTQVAISGFNFEQGRLLNTRVDNNYETSPVRSITSGGTITWTDNLENQPVIPINEDKDITRVNYERNFTQGKWSSICLPFNMNNRQMREQFGEETAVVLLKNIHDDGKIELIWHINQDIIAGYPYFILPRGEVNHRNVKNGVITKITADAYFDKEIDNEHPLISIGSNGKTFDWLDTYNGDNYKADYPYVFEGNFKKEVLPAGSYVMSNNGTLTKLKEAAAAKPFRAYLKYQGSNPNHAKPLYTSVNWQNEETTSIDDIIFQNGILMESTDVYGIDGTVVRRDAQNLSNLSKGVYIVNGKKFVVK